MGAYFYKKIDAFTSGESAGNPAACLYLDEDQKLSPSQMQTIAMEHKGFVSEVVFCRRNPEAGYDLSYYSSECEVDFCGHGTIACMFSLIENTHSLMKLSEIPVHTKRKGSLTVYNRIREQNAVYISAPEPVYIGTDLTADIIAQQLNVEADCISALYPIDLINAGLSTLIVPLFTLAQEISVTPNEASLRQFCLDQGIDIILIYSVDVLDHRNIAHTRVFAPKYGYLEDPATGSGNSAFGYYMLKNQIWSGEPVSVEQGGAHAPYNLVKLMSEDGQVLFGGAATDRIVGEYYLLY
jgi:PhzF family phenazine biosynthesis protein